MRHPAWLVTNIMQKSMLKMKKSTLIYFLWRQYLFVALLLGTVHWYCLPKFLFSRPFFCRYVHLSKDDVDIDILQANFTALMSMPAFLGFRALTSSNRIQLVRKLIAMPPMLLEPSNKALKIKTHKNVLVFLRMICIAFVLNRIYQRRS